MLSAGRRFASTQHPAPSTVFRRIIASRPSGERMDMSPENHPAAPPPIERIVIQVDAPPAATRSITQVTISAVGDPRAPGAQLAVVRSQREEALP